MKTPTTLTAPDFIVFEAHRGEIAMAWPAPDGSVSTRAVDLSAADTRETLPALGTD